MGVPEQAPQSRARGVVVPTNDANVSTQLDPSSFGMIVRNNHHLPKVLLKS